MQANAVRVRLVSAGRRPRVVRAADRPDLPASAGRPGLQGRRRVVCRRGRAGAPGSSLEAGDTELAVALGPRSCDEPAAGRHAGGGQGLRHCRLRGGASGAGREPARGPEHHPSPDRRADDPAWGATRSANGSGSWARRSSARPRRSRYFARPGIGPPRRLVLFRWTADRQSPAPGADLVAVPREDGLHEIGPLVLRLLGVRDLPRNMPSAAVRSLKTVSRVGSSISFQSIRDEYGPGEGGTILPLSRPPWEGTVSNRCSSPRRQRDRGSAPRRLL
jgi:hypothetical protein